LPVRPLCRGLAGRAGPAVLAPWSGAVGRPLKREGIFRLPFCSAGVASLLATRRLITLRILNIAQCYGGAVMDVAERPDWAKKPLWQLTPEELTEALAYVEEHEPSDEALSRALAVQLAELTVGVH